MLRLLRLDALQLLRDRLALTVLVIGSLACLIAGTVGHAWLASQLEDASAVAQTATTERGTSREQWAKAPGVPPEEAVLLPTRLTVSTQIAPPLLPDFTVARSALEPNAASVRLATRPDALFTRYQVANPERLARGGVDLSFVAVALAPLLLIGLGYGVFVGDRDSGTARLWLAQAGSPLRLLAVRSFNRLALVVLPLAAAVLTLLALGPDIDGRWAAGGLWLVVALIGLLFWWAVILLVNSLRVSAETAALVLVAAWAALVFVIPVATASAATVLNPPPSRFEQIAAARSAEVRASRDFDDDHPDLSSSTLEGRRTSVLKGVEVRAAVAEAVRPLAQAYDERIAAQRTFLRRLAVLSPPALTADALASVARTDLDFYASQRRAVVDYLEPFGRALTSATQGGRAIDAATFDALPRFSAPPPPPVRLAPAGWVLLITSALMLWALARLRRIQPL